MDILQKIADHIGSRPSYPLKLRGVAGSLDAFLIARTAERLSLPILVITPEMESAVRLKEDLTFFSDIHPLLYPCHDTLPFVPLLPSKELLAQRIHTLYQLLTGEGPRVVVLPVQAALEPTIPKGVLKGELEYVTQGEEVDREALSDWLSRHGYERVAVVQERGEYSIRGEIFDIFPPGVDHPVRLDFFDDEIEAIRPFDEETQRSIGHIEELVILPCDEVIYRKDLVDGFKERLISEAEAAGWSPSKVHAILSQADENRLGQWQRPLFPLFYQERAAIFDYLSEGAVLFFVAWEGCLDKAKEFIQRFSMRYEEARGDNRVLSSLSSFVGSEDHIAETATRRGAVLIADTSWSGRDGKDDGPVLELSSSPTASELVPIQGAGRAVAAASLAKIAQWLEQERRVILQAETPKMAGRIRELLKLKGIVKDNEELPSLPTPCGLERVSSPISLYLGRLHSGFLWDGWCIISQSDLFGRREAATGRGRKRAPTLQFDELNSGDFIVHRDHGIGIYKGLETLTIGGVAGEFLHLEYRGGDKLYLPVHRLGVIEKYVGIEGKVPPLDKLGGKTWAMKTQKVKKAIREIAHELVELYAKRKVKQGFSFSPPDELYREFEAAFPYEETPDQLTVIREILEDMASPRPMDRLLCGDVGYGKTEVAMRAAFKAVSDGKQVAVLVPTTLLAEQHERTFKRRFARFPVRIAAVSRLKSRREQKEILKGVREHAIDILIGTHRLLQADVVFHDLGLLIVDEEQRFGVRHKERLKRLKSDVDCLTLTATPIPRTLQLSLLGVRDLSIINTPPKDRQPIHTFLAPFDETIIQEAIVREKERGGQVYLVHNRISGLERLASLVKRLVPHVRVEVAHGQMDPTRLEEVMIGFVRREIDCLVCTTIIESGLDIPFANTMIINRADMLGLADLYQLRGRVGRSDRQAYAYLLVPRAEGLTADARKRLRAVMEMTTAGGGFRLAMKDLQLRGAGNILGTSQSGQIAKVGYEMYLELLQTAVNELKGIQREDTIDPEVNLNIPAYIPEEYVEDVAERLRLYRRMSRVADGEEEELLREELEDRFGPMPVEVANLFQVMKIKRLLRRIRVVRCDGDPTGHIVLTFHASGPPDPEALLLWTTRNKNIKFSPDERLILSIPKQKKDKNGLFPIIKVLHEMVQEATKS